ncbi:MAG: glycosyltransferase family 2 protein [Chitinophagaceae bacterium]|nr:glycosyltransferase family 2 protein [Rubrivivax sp.]
MRTYLYGLLRKYLSLFVLQDNSIVEIDPASDLIIRHFARGRVCMRGPSNADGDAVSERVVPLSSLTEPFPDFMLLNGMLHYERDIQRLLNELGGYCGSNTRVIIIYYNSLWRPLMRLATRFGLRAKTPELNWLANEDINNLLALENFEHVRHDRRVLIPVWIPLLSNLINKYLAPLPGFRMFCLLNIVVARAAGKAEAGRNPSVSIVVPARNEAGNIESILGRLPQLGPHDELILVEGHSTDRTWAVIQDVYQRYKGERSIVIARQEGKGKGDAVRKGFDLARNDILMILDADMTVPPETLVNFYRAIVSDKAEFVNGSRLVYPMEDKAMRFLNLLGNKFFAAAFSFVLGQRFKDTLCGTKVISRSNYMKLARQRAYFGDFDPFGDFDLIFGAARMCLKTIEVPVAYGQRTYGETNIARWRHGLLLLTMLIFAARRIRFI